MAEIIRVPRSEMAGGSEVPAVILGDNGFLRRYGSTLTITEISRRIRYALDRADIGISAGDERVLEAARRARAPWVLHHTDVAFQADGRKAHFGRSMATLHQLLKARAPEFPQTDKLMGAFVASFARNIPYRSGAKFTMDSATTKRVRDRIHKYQPAMTTIGGDYLDALVALGAIDEARAALQPILAECRSAASIPVLTTYLAGLAESRDLLRIADGFAAVMAPLNEIGVAMPPDRDVVIDSLRRLGLPVVAMHVLAGGAIKPTPALQYALHRDRAAAVVVGASSPEHISLLMTATRQIFEGVEAR
jgi:hypothetical protein